VFVGYVPAWKFVLHIVLQGTGDPFLSAASAFCSHSPNLLEYGKKVDIRRWHIHDAMYVRIKGTATAAVDEQRPKAGGLYHANQVAAFDYSERQAAFAARIKGCVSRAFHAIGAGPQTQEIIFWNLYVTRNLERDDIKNKPDEFIEGVKSIYGEAGIKVFEYMLTREIKREFGITAEFDKEPIQDRGASDLISLIAYAALDSQDNP
jgi:hypothetical protein